MPIQNRIQWKELAVDTLYDIAGSILYALGIYTFALHAAFAPGGVSGVALLLNYLFQWPVGVTSLVLNLPILAACFHTLGRRFLLKSLRTMLISTFFMDVIFPLFPTYQGDPLLAALFTGVCTGAGLALIYMRGSSTGGADFIICAAKKRMPHLSFGQITLAIDGVVILLGGLVYQNINALLYGLLSVFATTVVMDKIIFGAGSGKLALIITEESKAPAIVQGISDSVDRGCTIIPAVGSFSGRRKAMLMCACSKSEIFPVRMAAQAVDERAMVMVCEASEVFGEGFRPANED